MVAAELLKQSHKRAANASADGPSEGSKKLQTSDIRMKAKVKYLDNGSVSVETHHGAVFYEIKVLVFMLVHLFSFPERKARKMCWGYGLDPRPKSKHRAQSCRDHSADGHSSTGSGEYHNFPNGFTFAIRDKYKEYRQKCNEQDFR